MVLLLWFGSLALRLPRYWRGELPNRVSGQLGLSSYRGSRSRAAVRMAPIVAIWGTLFFGTAVALAFINLKSVGGYIAMGQHLLRVGPFLFSPYPSSSSIDRSA